MKTRSLPAAARGFVALACLAGAGQALAQAGPYGPYGPATPPPPYGAPYPYPYPPPPTPAPVRAPHSPVDEYRAGVDVFGSGQRIHNGNGHQSSDGGVGVRARFDLTRNLFVDGEVQGNRYNDHCDNGCYDGGYYGYRNNDHSDLDQYRVGLGLKTPLAPFGFAAPVPQAWAKAQYTEFETRTRYTDYANPINGDPYYGYPTYRSTTRTRGPGLHAGLRVPFSPYVALYGQGGYIWTRGDGARLDGPEFTGGLDVTPLPYRFDRLKLFVEYRYTDLRGHDNSGDARIGDVRAGVRFGFGR